MVPMTVCEKVHQGLKKHLKYHRKEIASPYQPASVVYPKDVIKKFFTEEIIKLLLDCRCGGRKCCFQIQTSNEIFRSPSLVHDSYSLALAVLIHTKQPWLISRLVELGLEDRHLEVSLLTAETWQRIEQSLPDNLLEKCDFHKFKTEQPCFFMPKLRSDRKHVQRIPNHFRLPINAEEYVLGEGGFSKVYKRQMLEGYHDFPSVDDEQVAIKVYSNFDSASDALLDKERDNQERYDHEYIMPLQAALYHRGLSMAIYPLAESDLNQLLARDPPEELRKDPRQAWTKFVNMLSALHYIHTGIPDGYGYHFDLKPHNILICKEKWMIADLGLAHTKLQVDGLSETSRGPGSDEYGAPELRPHRSYDVWSKGCIGLVIAVWLKRGKKGVEDFRQSRKQNNLGAILYCFHHDGELKQCVKDLLQELCGNNEDSSHSNEDAEIGRGVAKVLCKMLRIDQHERPSALEAENEIRELLGMPPNSSVPPTVPASPRFVRPQLALTVPRQRSLSASSLTTLLDPRSSPQDSVAVFPKITSSPTNTIGHSEPFKFETGQPLKQLEGSHSSPITPSITISDAEETEARVLNEKRKLDTTAGQGQELMFTSSLSRKRSSSDSGLGSVSETAMEPWYIQHLVKRPKME